MTPMRTSPSTGALFLLLAAVLSCGLHQAQAGRVLSSTTARGTQSRRLTSNPSSMVNTQQPMVMSFAPPNKTQPIPSCYANAPRAQLWAQNSGSYTDQNRPVKDDQVFDLMIDICNFIGQYYAGEGGCCSAVDMYGDSFLAQNSMSNGRSLAAYTAYTPLPGYQWNQLGYSNWQIIDSQNFVCSNIDPRAPSSLSCEHSWSQAQGSTITVDNSVTVGKSTTNSWEVSTSFDFVSASSSYSYTFSTDWTQGEAKAYDNTITQTYQTSVSVPPGNCSSLYLEVLQRQAYGELVTQVQLSNYVIFYGAGITSHEWRTPQNWLTHAQSLGYKVPDYWRSVIQNNVVNQVAQVSLTQLQGQTGNLVLDPRNIACQAGAQGK